MWKGMNMIRTINNCIIAILLIGILGGCSRTEGTSDTTLSNQPAELIQQTSVAVTFEREDIPEEVREEMLGVTISENSLMKFEDLAYLTLTYVGYDGKDHIGNMIVDKKLADEVISIFKELYEVKFPIELIEPAYKYNGDDELSMESNNTSAFNDRPITGGTGMSYHQLGRAIDINPYVNPYVKNSAGIVLPASAQTYTDREMDEKGMIKEDGECVRIFKKYGWSWGGDWTSLKDYQHFEKR